MMLALSKRDGLNFFLSIIIVLAPVFSNYMMVGSISIGDFFVFTAVILLIKHIRLNLIDIGSIVIALIVILIGFYVLYDEGLDLGFLRMAFYYFLFFIVISLRDKINFEKFFSVYVYSCIFFSASLISQWVAYEFLHISFPLQLPIPYYEPDTLKIIDHVFRSGGWFKEPSYFAIFLIPAIFYLLEKRFYLKYSLIAFAGIISTSSLAIFVFLLSILIFLIKNKNGWLWLTYLLPVFAVVFFCVLHFFSEWTFVSRVIGIFFDGGTLNERLLPVLDIFHLSADITPNPVAHGLVITAGDGDAIWYNSAAYILASLGWLGFLFIFLNFLRLGIFAWMIVSILTLTTHIFSGPYSFFIVFALLGFNIESRRLNLEKCSSRS